jgi:hypothetical protein
MYVGCDGEIHFSVGGISRVRQSIGLGQKLLLPHDILGTREAHSQTLSAGNVEKGCHAIGLQTFEEVLEPSVIVGQRQCIQHWEMKFRLLLLLLVALSLPGFANIGIATTALPNGVLKDAYYGVVSASGGCTPYIWKVTSGSLPAGVAMRVSSSTTSIVLSGTPTKAAAYSFTVSATGCGGNTAKTSYKVAVQPGAHHVVNLKWKASTTTNVAGYNIYRGPDGKSWAKINASLAASTIYSDLTVADSSTYFYAATAVDIKGKESKKSNIAKSVFP